MISTDRLKDNREDSANGKNTTFSNAEDRASKALIPSLSDDWPPLPVNRDEGVYIYSADGRRYMDFIAGIAVTNLARQLHIKSRTIYPSNVCQGKEMNVVY
jgi:4-aminobutyrate aminotransferase-like enzyme